MLAIVAKKHSLGPISVYVQEKKRRGGSTDNIQTGEEALTFYKGTEQKDQGSYIIFGMSVRDVKSEFLDKEGDEAGKHGNLDRI